MRNQSIFQIFNQKILKFNQKIIRNSLSDKKSRVFFLVDFITTLSYCFLQGITSLRLACTTLFHGACGLKVKPVKFSTFRDAFNRFDYSTFKKMFFNLSMNLKLFHIPELSLLKHITLVDGSVLPLSLHAHWANFRKNKKAAKLHLAWNLNQMIAEDLVVTEAKGDEKKAFRKLIQPQHLYVLDRGYVSFELFDELAIKGAYFVCRGRKNLVYEVLDRSMERFGGYGKKALDCLIYFHNDPKKSLYRLVYFKENGTRFYLLSNDFSLKVEDIILLYAARWQIELVFKFIKRTLNGVHAYSESENGLYIQFYMMAILALLMLHLKQGCQKNTGIIPKKETLDLYPGKIVSRFGERLKTHWKIGTYWLTVFRLNLKNPLTKKIRRDLACL